MPKETCNKSKCLIAYISGEASSHSIKSKCLKTELKREFTGVESVKLPKRSQYWRGYGFVKFASRASLLDFLERSYVYLENLGLTLTVKPHKHKENIVKQQKEPKIQRKIRVIDVPSCWDDLILREKLQVFGDIESCFIKKGPPRFEAEGVVIFSKAQSALKSVLSKKIHYGFKGEFLKLFFHDESYDQEISQRYFNAKGGDINMLKLELNELKEEEITNGKEKERERATPGVGDKRVHFTEDHPNFIAAENLAYVGHMAYQKRKESKEIVKSWYKKSEINYHRLRPTRSGYYNIFPYNLMRSMSSFKNYRINSGL